MNITLKIIRSGPWKWYVNEKYKQIALDGISGHCIMDFDRWGTQGAKPRFNDMFVHDESYSLMKGSNEYASPIPGREHHASWQKRIDHPIAVAIEQTPAMILALELITAGIARIEPATREFCFNGMRYSMGNPVDWTRIMNGIGWLKAVNALEKDNIS